MSPSIDGKVCIASRNVSEQKGALLVIRNHTAVQVGLRLLQALLGADSLTRSHSLLAAYS